jgi:hypothetical protein
VIAAGYDPDMEAPALRIDDDRVQVAPDSIQGFARRHSQSRNLDAIVISNEWFLVILLAASSSMQIFTFPK